MVACSNAGSCSRIDFAVMLPCFHCSHGWIDHAVGKLELYRPIDKVYDQGKTAPGYPDVTKHELWVAIEKVGFPISEIEPREKADAMVQELFERYGREQTAIASWLARHKADKYLVAFRTQGLRTLEDIAAIDIGFKDLKFFGIRDLSLQKRLFNDLVRLGMAEPKPHQI